MLKVTALVGLRARIRIQVLIQVPVLCSESHGMHFCAAHGQQFFCLKMSSQLQLESVRNQGDHLDLFQQQPAHVKTLKFTLLCFFVKEFKPHFYPGEKPKQTQTISIIPMNIPYLLRRPVICLYRAQKKLYKFRTADHVWEKDFMKFLMFLSSFLPPQ